MYNKPHGKPVGYQQHSQLFDDTSNDPRGYSSQYEGFDQNKAPFQPSPMYAGQPQQTSINPTFAGVNLANDPLVSGLAMQYGQNLVGQGKSYVDEKLGSYVNVSKVKYYFAVDTKYVLHKLTLLFFPYSHSNWNIEAYASEDGEPAQPRYQVNAPDLYIPLISFVTYILVAGLCLGLQSRFSPDVLGLQASWTVVWLFLEMLVASVSLHVLGMQSQMPTLHLLSLASYKYVGMVFSLLSCILLGTNGYYAILGYSSFSLSFFLFRTLRAQLGKTPSQFTSDGTKRRLYILMLMVGVQPGFMWWLTRHLC